MSSVEIRTAGPAETERVGATLGRLIAGGGGRGSGVAVFGELGAGKTVFIRGLARGLGVDDPGEVRSPSYLMMVEHPGPVPLFHVDAYFLDKGVRLAEEGALEEALERGVVAVEWPERLPWPCPAEWLRVRIGVRSAVERVLVIEGAPDTWVGDLLGAGPGESPPQGREGLSWPPEIPG
jgi:tRNA threonylcarbamoyladenosine biosynthesis protein TsaE